MRGLLFVSLVLCLLVPACSAPLTAPAASRSVPTVTAKKGTLHAGLGTKDVTDLPYLMALDMLETEGYTVDKTQYAQFELITVALTQGDLDIAGASRQTTWSAIAKGTPLREIISKSHNYYVLAARQAIRSCSDLDGKTLALGATTGVVPVMVNAYLKAQCPAARPKIVVIAGTDSRTAALLAGQVDASPVDPAALLLIEHDAPGRFHALAALDKLYPQLEIAGFFVNPEWAAQHADVVRDFLRAMITARRQLQDSTARRQAVERYFGADDSAAQQTADRYVERGIWDINGGFSLESVQVMMDFLTSGGSLPATIKAQDVADPSYLDTVLNELGRQ